MTELNFEMVGIEEMTKEQGIELDTYYLVVGCSESIMKPALHIAMYYDLGENDPLIWITEEGLHITDVTYVSRYPAPIVDEYTGELVISDYTL